MTNKPNIIYIMADDMGYGDLGCFGAEKIPTPNMDSIAKNGVKFTDAHSSSAVCTPSRYSVMTGRYCWRTWLKRWVLGGFGATLIEPERETVASMLKKQGYATFAVGKWHLGFNWKKEDGTPVVEPDKYGVIVDEEHINGFSVDYSKDISGGPLDLGFERFWGISGSLDMPPYCFIENRRTVGIPDREKSPYEAQQAPGLMAEYWKDDQCDITFSKKAGEYINKHISSEPEKPFFLYMTPAAPHRPCVPPEFIKGRSQAGARGDAVCLVDWMVGEVLETLRKLDIEKNTLLIVTSDNGARSRCVNGKTYGHKANGDWRGEKTDIWEGGHREPFVAQWPGKIKPGSQCNQTICLSDLMATCAEIIDTDIPEGMAEDSKSFLSCLKKPETSGPVRKSLIHHSGAGMFSIRQNNWKLICGLGSGGSTVPHESYVPGGPEGQLYDLSKDPAETNNLYMDKPEIVEQMKKLLEEKKI